MLIVFLGVIALFVLLGVVFSKGKGAFLIAGYNTASKVKKEEYDEKALCRCMGKLMFALAGCWVPVAVGAMLDWMWLLWLGLGLYVVVILGGVIYANTGGRFLKEK